MSERSKGACLTKAEYDRKYHVEHRDKKLAQRKANHLKNKEHSAAYNKKYALDNKETLVKYTRERKYGLTDGVYQALLISQGEVCAICNQPETIITKQGTIKRLAVDHCHTTGRVRGLLCTFCNTMLGYARDNTEIMTNAILYIKAGQNE